MDKKDTYLYGTLLALVKEQLSAIQKQVSGGGLGMWGKARFSSRTTEIQKFIVKILERKQAATENQALAEMVVDLDGIRDDKRVWTDVTQEELDYVRSILSGL